MAETVKHSAGRMRRRRRFDVRDETVSKKKKKSKKYDCY